MAKGRKIAPGRTLSSLTTPQVRMILRIYWTDQYTRRALDLRTTPGLRVRLARQFNVSVEVIKKIVGIKHNQHGQRQRQRFKTISLKSLQRSVKTRLQRRGLETKSRPIGRPRKTRKQHHG